MSGLSHSTDPFRLFGVKLELPAFISEMAQPILKTTRVEPQILCEGEPLPPSKRLVVILPDADIDMVSLPRRIRNLALPDHSDVLLMVKPCRDANEFLSHLNLAAIAAMVRDPRISVQTRLVMNQPLARAARKYAQPGSTFVCFEEHKVRRFFRKHPLAEVLAQKTRRPVYTLAGSAEEIVDPLTPVMADVIFMALSILSLVGFFALEVWIGQNSTGVLQSIVQILAVAAEVGLIATIANKMFRV